METTQLVYHFDYSWLYKTLSYFPLVREFTPIKLFWSVRATSGSLAFVRFATCVVRLFYPFLLMQPSFQALLLVAATAWHCSKPLNLIGVACCSESQTQRLIHSECSWKSSSHHQRCWTAASWLVSCYIILYYDFFTKVENKCLAIHSSNYLDSNKNQPSLAEALQNLWLKV